jgi:hypothetical protein
MGFASLNPSYELLIIGGSSFALRLACLRWHDDGAGFVVILVGDRSSPGAVAWHSSIKQERP